MGRKLSKRLIVTIIAFVMVIMIIPVTAKKAEAATKIDVAPYAKIEYGNTNNVQCGTIRYVQQNGGQAGDGPNYYSNYWSPADMATARWNCYAASVSMALSYIGVNRLPGVIYSGGCQWSQPGATFQQPSIASGVENYINGNGKYSPVILHIIPYAGRATGEHWVIIAGKVSGNTYRIVDPINASHGSTWNATISGNTMTYWNGCSDTITQVFQYYNPNGKIIDDKAKPTISNVHVSNLNSSGYTVTCTVSDNVGVTQVKFPTWTDKNGQDDLIWHVGSVSGNTASFTVKVSDHKGESGIYITDIYAYDAAGNESTFARKVVTVPQKDTQKPKISDVKVTNLSSTGYTVTCMVSDNVGVTQVKFPTWTTKGGQDDLIWHVGSISGNTASFTVKVSDHKGEPGEYMTDIYAYDADGNVSAMSRKVVVVPTKDVTAPKITNVKISKVDATGYTVTCTVTDDRHVNRVQFPTWTLKNDQDDIAQDWGTSTKVRGNISGSTATFRVDVADHKYETGFYVTHIYAWDDEGNTSYSYAPVVNVPRKSTTSTPTTKQEQTITANSVIKTAGDKIFDLGASAPGKLSYKSNNKKVATIDNSGKVTIKGAGIATITINADATSTYKATSKQVTVTVRPRSITLTSVANSKKGKLIIKWKKGSGISGYRIQIAQNANFKGAKTYTIKKAGTVTKTVSVKKGKTYWVRIQTYNGNVSSGWSKIKKVKINK